MEIISTFSQSLKQIKSIRIVPFFFIRNFSWIFLTPGQWSITIGAREKKWTVIYLADFGQGPIMLSRGNTLPG